MKIPRATSSLKKMIARKRAELKILTLKYRHIPQPGQKRKLLICPKCGKKFYYWQYASYHAETKKHYGSYVP